MKSVALSLSKSPPLYTSPSHFLSPHFSITTEFLASPFPRHSFLTMPPCVHLSRTQTPPPVDDNLFDKYVKFRRPNFVHTQVQTVVDEGVFENDDALWSRMKEEARSDIDREPILSNYYFTSILSHDSMETALSNYLSVKLSNSILPSGPLYDIFLGVLKENPEMMRAVSDDLRAVKERDPACISYIHCFLNFKGFSAMQAYRIGHKLWCNDRKILALLIQNRVSEVFAVDIHPGAKIGGGILLDHATGVVVGETAVIGNNVSILHNVTLGGTGKVCGDRHPKIGDGVLIGAGTCVLGNVVIEDGAKIGAGSVVLKRVPARTTAVGNPAKLIGGKDNPVKMDKMPSLTMDQTSWSDYVI